MCRGPTPYMVFHRPSRAVKMDPGALSQVAPSSLKIGLCVLPHMKVKLVGCQRGRLWPLPGHTKGNGTLEAKFEWWNSHVVIDTHLLLPLEPLLQLQPQVGCCWRSAESLSGLHSHVGGEGPPGWRDLDRYRTKRLFLPHYAWERTREVGGWRR